MDGMDDSRNRRWDEMRGNSDDEERVDEEKSI